MKKDWFLPKTLARRLAAGGVSHREAAYLLLAGYLFTTLIYYSAITWSNPPWTWLSLLEAIAVVLITVSGFTRCYDVAGGDRGEHFLRDFICLSTGVWFWCTLLVWSVYWSVLWLFRSTLFAAYEYQHLGLARNLASIGADFNWLWTFLVALAWPMLFYRWMAQCLRRSSPKA